MKSYFVSLKILVCLVMFSAAFSLSCREKPPAVGDINKPEPKIEKIDVPTPKTDVNVVELKPPVKIAAGDVAVTINGVSITESEIEKLIKPQIDMIAKQASDRPPAFIEQYKKMLRQQALDRLIVGRLLDEKAKEANVAVTEEEVLNQIKQIASTQRPPLSLEEFKKKIESYGQSFDFAKQQIRNGLIRQKVVEAQLAGKINVTEDDAKKFYDENPKRYETPEQVRASHILIKPDVTDPNADPNDAKAKALAKAQNLLKQIKDGADFAELAKANSDCPSAPRGGDLNFFQRGQMVPPFDKAAFELEVGKISDIVETKFGYHIIKATDHKDAGVTSFEQAKDGVIQQLTQKKQRDFAMQYIESLKAKANIVYPPGKEPQQMGRPPVRPGAPRQIKPPTP